MGRIRIVTDSTADLPKETADRLGIIVVPLKVNFGHDVYRDGADLTPSEFITRLKRETDLPTTSQPSPGEFVAVYEKLIAKGDTVISIHISGKLSGTVQSAKTAKTMTDSRDIYVIDSKTASMGLGLIVLAAAKAAEEGLSLREILSMVNEKIERSFVIFLVQTLEYLEKGGRIGKASTLLGSILKIKPILTIEDGQVIPLEKARGESKAIERISEIIAERTDSSRWYKCAFVYGDNYGGALKLKERLSEVLNSEKPLVTELGPVIMAHVGPELIGIAICPE